MSSRLKWILPALLALVTLSCTLPSLPFLKLQPTAAGSIRPKFANFSDSGIKMNLSAFQSAGCKADAQGFLRCPPTTPPFDVLGCAEIAAGPDALAGLKPQNGLMVCLMDTDSDADLAQDQYILQEGCLAPAYVRYVVSNGGKFSLLKNKAALKAAFAPIDSPEEALAYAVAATGFKAYFGLKDTNLRYLSAQIQDTHVTAEPNNYYGVLLYRYDLCGCGPHTTSSVLVHVSSAGEVITDDAHPAWEDPAQDGLCVD
jgi:hypothetical protein